MGIVMGAKVRYFPHTPSPALAERGMHSLDTEIAPGDDGSVSAEITGWHDDGTSVNLRIVDANAAVHWRKSVCYNPATPPEDLRYCVPALVAPQGGGGPGEPDQ